MTPRIQAAWTSLPPAGGHASAVQVRIGAWPRDLAGEGPARPLDGPLVLDDVLLHLRLLDAAGHAEHEGEPVATLRLTLEVDPAGRAVVRAVEDVSASEDLPGGWRVDEATRRPTLPRLQLELGGREASGPAVEVPVPVVTDPDRHLQVSPGAGATVTMSLMLRLRRRGQAADDVDLARPRAVLRVTAPFEAPGLDERLTAQVFRMYESMWRLGVTGDAELDVRRHRAIDGLRGGDPGWQGPPPRRGTKLATSADLLDSWARAMGASARKQDPYCGYTAGRAYLASVRPHWLFNFADGAGVTGFSSTTRIQRVLSYADPVSRLCGVAIRRRDGTPQLCEEGDVIEEVISLAEAHLLAGAGRMLLPISNGYDTSSPERTEFPGASRRADPELDPEELAAREALFFPSGDLPPRVRPGDVLIVGNGWAGLDTPSRHAVFEALRQRRVARNRLGTHFGEHITILEGACRGGCALCERDGLEPEGGPFVHLLEGNTIAGSAAGSCLIWDPAFERALELTSGAAFDANGRREEGVDFRTPEGTRELVRRRVTERGVPGEHRRRAAIEEALVAVLGDVAKRSHVARRRRPLVFCERRGSKAAAVIYAGRFSPLDARSDLPLIGLTRGNEGSKAVLTADETARRMRAFVDETYSAATHRPAWLVPCEERARAAIELVDDLYLGGPRMNLDLEAWTRHVAGLRRQDTPERAAARIEAGRARVGRPELVTWHQGAADLPWGSGCPTLPLLLAYWAGQLTAVDFGVVFLVHGPSSWPLEEESAALALGLSPPEEDPPERRWPDSPAQTGDVVVFTYPGAPASTFDHIAVATGVEDEILSLEPPPSDDLVPSPVLRPGPIEQPVAPLRLSTIRAYLDHAQAGLVVRLVRWRF